MRKFFIVSCLLAFFFVGESQVVINEVLAGNKTSVTDPDFGKYADFIEIFNAGSSTLNVGGYYLSDQREQLDKWKIPSGVTMASNTYVVFWADNEGEGFHTNFKLSSSGETVYLSNPMGEVIDSLEYGYMIDDQSYGRLPDGSDNLVEMNPATPGKENKKGTVIVKAQKPVFSSTRVFYTQATTVSIGSEPGAQVRYTINGADPTESSTLYAGAIEIGKSTVLKAKSFVANKKASDVAVHTYIFETRAFNLPIVSVSTDPNWLYNPDTGIFMEGPNAEIGEPHYGANYWLDKEIPMYFEYISPKGEKLVSVPTGAAIKGGYSRMHPKKSFTVECDDKWGSSNFNYKFFNDKPQKKIEKLYLRNSGNDWAVTMFRDAYIHEITKKYMDLDVQSYQPAVIFINGRYEGIQNIRENLGNNYFKENYGIDKDELDFIYGGNEVLQGSFDDYSKMIDFASKSDLTNEANYNYMKANMDIAEYIDYQILEIYVANTDWPGNNIKFWKEKKDGSKWRWVLYDTDFGLGIWGRESPCSNTLASATATSGPDWPNPSWSTLLFRSLLTNTEFKNQFIQRYAYHMNTTFSMGHMKPICDSLAANIASEMEYHIQYWNAPGSIEEWRSQVDVMTTWSSERPECAKQHVIDYFGLNGSMMKLSVLHDTAKGSVRLESKNLDGNHAGEYFPGVPVTLVAKPWKEYAFKCWKLKKSQSTSGEVKTVVAAKSDWKYLDDGSNQETAWTASTFDDATWKNGVGPLGYNEGNTIATTVEFGPDARNKYQTTYFRKTFNLDESNFTGASIKLMRGDGAVVYINGVEVVRSNMPGGELFYDTYAYGAEEASEVSYTTYRLPVNLLEILKQGQNTIAVEVHQTNASSSDMSFDLQLDVERPVTSDDSVDVEEVKSPTVTLQMDKNITIEAFYEKLNPLVITEIYNTPSDQSEQYVEILNTGTFDIDLSGMTIVGGTISHSFPPGFVLAKNQFVLLCKNTQKYASLSCQKVQWANGTLATSGTIIIKSSEGNTVDVVNYASDKPWPENSAATGKSIFLSKPSLDNNDGANWQLSGYEHRTPGGYPVAKKVSGIFINECMGDNTVAVADESGEFDDWIELYNANDHAVDVGGLYLTDDASKKLRFKMTDSMPELTTIAPRGYLLVWADDDPSQGPLHANFSIAQSGEGVYLYQLSYTDTMLIDELAVPKMTSNRSFGRYTDGTATTQEFVLSTPGEANSTAGLIAGLYINEIMPSNNIIMDEKGDYDPWVEIYNSTSLPINLAGLCLSKSKSALCMWSFPSSNEAATTIPANGFKTVWLDGESSEGDLHASFTSRESSGIILLSQNVNNTYYQIAGLNYRVENENYSFGRYPDGWYELSQMNKPTPGISNAQYVLNSASNEAKTLIYPVPLGDVLNVSSASEVISVTVYNIQGASILKSSGSCLVDISSLRAGLYVVDVNTSEGANKWLVTKLSSGN